jgi:hypothetical protein
MSPACAFQPPAVCKITVQERRKRSAAPSSPLTRAVQIISTLQRRAPAASSPLLRADTEVEGSAATADAVAHAPCTSSSAFEAVLEVLQEVRSDRDALQARVRELERAAPVASAVLSVLHDLRTERDQLQGRVDYLQREVDILCASAQTSRAARHSWLAGTEFASPPCSRLRPEVRAGRSTSAPGALAPPPAEKRASLPAPSCREPPTSKQQRSQ